MAAASRPVTTSAPSSCRATVPPRCAISSAGLGRPRPTGPARRGGRSDSISSCVLTSAISRPRPMTSRWSAVSAISLIRWLETSTVRPSAASSRRNPRIQRMPSGSSPLTGSSNISTAGSPSSAAAMPSRCFMPSENPPTRAAATGQPGRASTSATRGLAMPLLRRRPAGARRAVRPAWTALASSSAPTSRSGAAAGVAAAADQGPAAGRRGPARASSASWWSCPRRSGRGSR